MDRTPHILVVDDHKEIRDLLARYLTQNGLRVSTASGGNEMRQQMRAAAIDLVILDVMMPGEDGLTLCKFLRQSSDVPIVLLTAVSEETDKVVGLEIGADDYVTKPFNPRELLARIRALLRRARSAETARPAAESRQYRFGEWSLDALRRTLTGKDGVEVPLGSAEFRLLLAFVSRPGVVLSRDQLLDITAGRSAQVFDRSIDNLVSRLRRRIEPDPQQPTFIKTVWGDGYTFAGTVEEIA
ncbi:response regulator [Rhizobiaceae bacterium BDR2-2]|uniref:Regulatory protein VirG n=1 Tax=Ectorhizobium quercum TaxID=2965071 RepID=A0AAE3MYE3_9HYPH|nr:response regulator [Ectorhizobium quercum]MCX8996756.1 response regulator [Ectorhizobium quercum]